MSETFDPYLKWLGIREADRPPNHYQLLGLKLFESDPEVISNLADRQMSHVRTFATGRHSAISQQLLNELASARVCLLNAKKKRVYDAELRTRQAPVAANTLVVLSSTDPDVISGTLPDFEVSANSSDFAAPLDSMRVNTRSFAKRRRTPGLAIAMVMMILLILVGGLAVLNLSQNAPGPQPAASRGEPQREATSVPSAVSTPKSSGTMPAKAPTIPQSKPKRPVATPSVPRNTDNTGGDPSAGQNNDKPDDRPDDSDEVTAAENSNKSDTASTAAPPTSATARLPVPTEVGLVGARKLVAELFDDEIEAAKNSADKATLADKLIAQAAQTNDDALARYRLLELARELAVEGESWPIASRAIEQIFSLHQVDESSLEATTLAELSKGAISTQDRAAIIRAALDAIDRAVVIDDYESAKKIVRTATNLAKKSAEDALQDAAKGASDWVVRCDKEFKANQPNMDALKKDPHDPAALTAVGRFECLIKGDWEAGLPRLAKGNDAELAALASTDLTNPGEHAERVQLAERWWDLATHLSGPFKPQAFGRAEFWYRLALPKLEGLGKTKVEKRLTEIAKYSPRMLAGKGRTAAQSMAARIYACGDDQFTLAVNGQPVLEAAGGQPRELDYEFFPGDIVTVRAVNTLGRRSFCCAIKFAKLEKSLLTSPGQRWQEYDPTSIDDWSHVTGIRGNRPARKGDGDFVQRIREASGTAVEPIWGTQGVCFLVLEIPRPADLP